MYLSTTTGDEELRRFWEVEDYDLDRPVMSLQEKAVVEHFCEGHSRSASGRFIVPLPIKLDALPLRNSRFQVVRTFK